ncbi:hypothetical protein MNBD_BACTEROID05-402 [hydrothermal vent metagenome]|uniref:Large ribosomal subunit protein uL29 n=1 Tax=hydrothermal vent metagenome TaxID=652676 RepID=A0A3B0T573_9ZZZZ
MEAKKLRELSSEELIQKEKSFKKDLFELNSQKKLGGVEKPSRFRLLKRDVARILTVLSERKIEDRKSEKV